MSQFQIFKKTVTINDEQYHLRPLSGRFIDKFFQIIGKLDANKGEDMAIGDVMDGETAKRFHELTLETFKKSYDQEDEKILDEFITQNLLQLIQPMIEVNIRNPDAVTVKQPE